MKKYTRLLRVVLWLLVLAWMAVIFRFSTENADESSSTSGAVIRWLLAHFTVFAVLGCLLTAACAVDLGPGKAFVAAMILGILYAFSDELHQYFVPGRACQLRDVCIDASGVLLGAGVFTLIRRTRMRRKT